LADFYQFYHLDIDKVRLDKGYILTIQLPTDARFVKKINGNLFDINQYLLDRIELIAEYILYSLSAKKSAKKPKSLLSEIEHKTMKKQTSEYKSVDMKEFKNWEKKWQVQ
jgi:hypothetical protein